MSPKKYYYARIIPSEFAYTNDTYGPFPTVMEALEAVDKNWNPSGYGSYWIEESIGKNGKLKPRRAGGPRLREYYEWKREHK